MEPEDVLCKAFGVERSAIDDDTSNKTLPQWDSLAHMTLVMELESVYGVSFSAADTLAMTNVKAIKQTLADYNVQW